MEDIFDIFVFLCRALHGAAEAVCLGEFFEVLLGLVRLGAFWADQIGLVLDQQAGNVGIGADFSIFLDDSFPFDGLLKRGSLIRRAHDHTTCISLHLPKAPLRYIFDTELNRSCPAMSQSCSLTGLPSTLDLSLVEKSHPMVGLTF